MALTEVVPDRLAVFERAETDGRHHARWALRAELEPVAAGTRLTMHLAYDGALWTGGLLDGCSTRKSVAVREGLNALLDAPARNAPVRVRVVR